MKYKNLSLVLLLGCIWAPVFMFMKIALTELMPLTIIALRLSIAAIPLFIILKINRVQLRPYLKLWKHFAVMGCFASALPFTLFVSSEQYIPSSMAGIINATTPIFTCILAHYVVSEKITRGKFIGILLGVLGVVFIYFPDIWDSDLGDEFGLTLAIIGALSEGVAMVYARKHLRELPQLVAPAFQILFAALYVIPLSLIFDQSYAMHFPSIGVIGALLGMGLLCTACAFVLYYYIIRTVGASQLSMATLLFPVVAIALGYIFLQETLSWQALVGTALILTALFISSPLMKKND